MFEKINNQTTIIGEGVSIEGDFTGQGDLELFGEIKGNINLSGHIKIGATSKVSANIVCGQAEISGKVKGKITAKQDVTLHTTASVMGDITAKEITIAKGAAVNGKIHVNTKNETVPQLEKTNEIKKK